MNQLFGCPRHYESIFCIFENMWMAQKYPSNIPIFIRSYNFPLFDSNPLSTHCRHHPAVVYPRRLELISFSHNLLYPAHPPPENITVTATSHTNRHTNRFCHTNSCGRFAFLVIQFPTSFRTRTISRWDSRTLAESVYVRIVSR